MKKTMMYLPEDLHRFLVSEAASRDISMAQLAREALSEYRTKVQTEKTAGVTPLIGVVDDAPPTDVARELDTPLGDEEWESWATKKGLRDPR